MTLPLLPLVGNTLFIDNSGWIEALSTCHRQLQYKSLNLRVGAAEKPALNFGSCIHLCLEHRYRKYGTDIVGPTFWNEIADIITGFFQEHPSSIEDWRNANWALTTIKRYMAKYETEDFALLGDKNGAPLIELPFAIELYRHRCPAGDNTLCPQEIIVVYTGRIDLLLALADGTKWTMDHKTTSQIGQQHWDKMRLSSQQKGYCWAVEQLTGHKLTGFVINTIRTKEPPQYVLNNVVSKYGKTQTPEAWWNESLQREKFYLKPNELDEWKRNTIALVENFFFNYERGYLPMETALGCASYGRCPYFDVCTLAEPDRDFFLASGLFADNVWSPLHQPTQSKQ